MGGAPRQIGGDAERQAEEDVERWGVLAAALGIVFELPEVRGNLGTPGVAYRWRQPPRVDAGPCSYRGGREACEGHAGNGRRRKRRRGLDPAGFDVSRTAMTIGSAAAVSV